MRPDPALLSLNTATVRAQWKLDRIIAGCERHGIRGIAPWRDQIAELKAGTGIDKIEPRRKPVKYGKGKRTKARA